MTKIKASDYTHSVWTGEKYDKPQTLDSLTAESLQVLANNPAIKRNQATRDAWLDRYIFSSEPNDCAECARSFGPHYIGECEHN